MRAAAILVLVLVAACSGGPGADLRETLPRARLDTLDTPLLLAEFPASGLQATLLPWGANGGVVTWRTGDGVSLSFRNGVLVATRGLGQDLMSADMAATLAAIGGGLRDDYPVFRSYLSGTGETVFGTMICSMGAAVPERIVNVGLAVDVDRYEETCRSPVETVANAYWIGPDGTMWRARQWVGAGTGYLVSERLVR